MEWEKERITLREREFQIKWESRSSISGAKESRIKTGSKWNYIFFSFIHRWWGKTRVNAMRKIYKKTRERKGSMTWWELFSQTQFAICFLLSRYLCRLSFDPEIKISYHHHFQPSSCHFAFHSPFNLALSSSQWTRFPAFPFIARVNWFFMIILTFFVCVAKWTRQLLDYKSISWRIYRILIAFTKELMMKIWVNVVALFVCR